MSEQEKETFAELERIFHRATLVCDPIEFAHRQHALLHALARHILEPYYLEMEQGKDE